MRRGLPAVLVLAVAGCATAPDLAAPPSPPSAWLDAAAPSATPAPDAWWRAGAVDPVLQNLLDRAGAVDDVAAAEARQRQAQAQARAASAGLFPALSITGEQTVTGVEDVRGSALSTGAIAITAPLSLFGADRSRSRAAAARAAAFRAELANARIEARRTAAESYVTLRTAQAQRIAAERAQAATAESLSLAESRARAGLESGLGLAQARAAADAARARPPGFAQAETQARAALESLLGLAPGALAEQLSAPADPPVLNAVPALSAPASVLARRPDLVAAEARLVAAGLEAEAARRDLWPTASLSATVAARDGAFEELGARSAGGVLGITAPVFNFGRLRALAAASGAAAEAEAFSYRAQVAAALGEVETQRARAVRAEAQREAQAAAVASAQEQANFARARYTSGLASFLDVLNAERAVYDAESALAQARGESALAQIGLAAAIGLGQEP